MNPHADPRAAAASGRTLGDAATALRERALAVLREVLAPHRGAPWALLDFPNYANAGDSAIWLGCRAALEAVGQPPPVYVCDKRTFEPEVLASRLGGGPILIHGGGNFGDVYASHQRLRETVAARFPDNPIVQLPQSIHFVHPEARDRAARTFHAHRRFTFLVRDDASLGRARRDLGLEARLCPDLAFGLAPLPERPRGGAGILWLSRGDGWRRHAPAEVGREALVSDWPPEGQFARGLWASALGRGVRLGAGGLPGLRPALWGCWERMARHRVDRALAWMSRADVVVTDRLHGHVLALLLGIPHVLLDDRTGKVHALHATWTSDLVQVRAARDPGEALEMARALRDAGGAATRTA